MPGGITTTSTIRIYERDGEEKNVGKDEVLVVQSHWNVPDWVDLKLGKITITVDAKLLMAAVDRATR